MASSVRVLTVTHVHPDQATTNPAPSHGDHAIKLSPFDTLFMAVTPVQRLFFYDGANLPPFPALSQSLRRSLAATLAVFAPLAGKLTATPSGDAFIDCSPAAVSSPGVRFVEAEYAGGESDMRRLARDAEHDAEAFVQLVPGLPVGALPAPVLAVQVTRPADGGGGAVTVGVAVHHAVADGQALWRFLLAWAAAAREGSPAAGAGFATPTFDRAAVSKDPKADEVARQFVRFFAPALPMVNTFPEPDITIQRRRTYVLSADQILSLKQRISQEQSSGAKDGALTVEPPSTYAAIASLVWTSVVRAKTSLTHHAYENDGAVSHLMFAGDCRARLRPPLPAAFFGNAVKSCYAMAAAGELRVDGGLTRAAAAVREAVRAGMEAVLDPVADAERWVERRAALPPGRVVQIGGSHRFAAHEADFGWGKPSRAELVSVFVREFVALLAAPGGGVQVSVALDSECMDGFDACFLSQLQHGSD